MTWSQTFEEIKALTPSDLQSLPRYYNVISLAMSIYVAMISESLGGLGHMFVMFVMLAELAQSTS